MKQRFFSLMLCMVMLAPAPAWAKSLTREQALLEATEKGNFARVEYVLSRGADVNVKDAFGWTPLMNVASAGRMDIATSLLANGANLELRDNGGTTALGLAAAKGRDDMVTLLLERGANINAKDGKGLDPLMMAAKGGFLGLTKTLLDKGANINLSDNDGNTTLMLAAKGAHREVVELVLDRGARIPTIGKDGEKLMVAAVLGDLDQIKKLAEGGVDLDLKTTGGGSRNALFWAAAMGNDFVVSYFLDRESEAEAKNPPKNQSSQPKKKILDDTIVFASGNGKLDVVRQLLNHHRDPNSKDRQGASSLTLAAEYGHADVVELLLENGADRNYKNPEGDSALIIAVKERHPHVVDLLIKNWADLEARDKKGKTPLVHAVMNNDIDITQKLLDKKVKLDTKDNEGYAALHIAAKRGYDQLAQLLSDHGADVNMKITQKSMTPLMFAARGGHTGTASILIGKGASVNAADSEGKNPLLLACEAGHTDTVSMLMDNGADFNAESREGVTPLMAAALKGQLPVVKLLIERGVPYDARSKKQGFSALWTASMKGRTQVIDYLWQTGADVNVKSKQGMSPLMAAVTNSEFDAVRMLLDKGVDQDIQNINRQNATDLAKKSNNFHILWLINSYRNIGVRALGEKKGGLFGVTVQDLNDALAKSVGRDTADGALVSGVLPGTPAKTADIREGDIILSVNNHSVKGAIPFSNMVEGQNPGTNIDLVLFRNGQFVNTSATLAQKPMRDFYEAMIKFDPTSGTDYVIYPPTRKPLDYNYYLFQGRVYSESGQVTLVERTQSDYNQGRYWSFLLPSSAGFKPRVRQEVMVIGKIVDVLNAETIIRKPIHIVVVEPVAIGDANGTLVYSSR